MLTAQVSSKSLNPGGIDVKEKAKTIQNIFYKNEA